MSETDKYRKDVYGDLENKTSPNPLIPAATVVLLREADQGFEVLMLEKNKGISFGGMWVFPGGKIDNDDYKGQDDIEIAAVNAALRESKEETGMNLSDEDLVMMSHWTPPESTPKRFSTWFFIAVTDKDDVCVDGSEILDHRWVTPKEALSVHAADEIQLAPPTWITLYQLSQHQDPAAAFNYFNEKQPMFFKTDLKISEDKVPVAIWSGDSAYGNADINSGKARHRLTLCKGGFVFENNAVEY